MESLQPDPGAVLDAALRADRDWIRTRGLYATHLEAVLELYPREQVFVGVAERFKAHPAGEYRRLFEFLGVADHPVESLPAERAHVRAYSAALDADTEAQWTAEYRDEIERLRELIDDPIPEWDAG